MRISIGYVVAGLLALTSYACATHFQIKYDASHICLLMDTNAQVILKNNNDSTSELTGTADGKCSILKNQTNANLTIAMDGNPISQVEFIFVNDNSSVFLEGITVTYILKSQTKKASNSNLRFTLSSDTQSYVCNYTEDIRVDGNVILRFNSIEVQAFQVNGTYSKDKNVCLKPTTDPTTALTTGEVTTTAVTTPDHTTGSDTTEHVTTDHVTTIPANESTSTAPPSNETTPVTTQLPITTPATPALPTFSVKDKKTGDFCIIAQFNASFSIHYMTNTSKTHKTFNIPEEKVRVIAGDCGSTSETLKLQWQAPKSYALWNLTLAVTKSPSSANLKSTRVEASSSFALTNITLDYVLDKENFPGTNLTGKVSATSYDDKRYSTAVGAYISCISNVKITFGDVDMTTDHMKIEAFRSSNTTSFGNKPADCPADAKKKTSNVVPIVVGAVLAGLVIVVLITYLIGRRRQQAGYENI